MIDPILRDDSSAIASDATFRQFAITATVMLAGFASIEAFVRNRWVAASVIGSLAIIIGAIGLTKPRALRPAFFVMMSVTTPVGWIISYILLGIMYFVVITPVAVLFRLMRRDALHLRRQQVDTYWRRRAARDIHSYFRQS